MITRSTVITKAALVTLGVVFIALTGYAMGFSWSDKDEDVPAQDIGQMKTWISEGKNLDQINPNSWKEILSEKEFYVLWEKGTERSFTGVLLKENREGVFVSKGCRIPVFSSKHKFKSGTGWPSFWEVFDKDNIVLKEDRSWGMRRIEVLSKCGEHLGHVFKDGPEPTGLRYCINSAALDFVPAGEKDPLGPYQANAVVVD